MSTTVRDLIKGSLRLIGAIATGQTPSANEEADCLSVLNEMLDSWSTERLTIFNTVRESFTLIPTQQAYTIGTGGDFDTTRPQLVENAGVMSGTIELPVDILTQDEWAAISLKSTSSTFPMKLYMEDAFPLATINLWPVPSAANSLILYSWKPLTAFASASTTFVMPPGYLMALRFNLAVMLAPEYGKTPNDLVMKGAVDGKSNIKRMNIKPQLLRCDPAIVQRRTYFNWRTGG